MSRQNFTSRRHNYRTENFSNWVLKSLPQSCHLSETKTFRHWLSLNFHWPLNNLPLTFIQCLVIENNPRLHLHRLFFTPWIFLSSFSNSLRFSRQFVCKENITTKVVNDFEQYQRFALTFKKIPWLLPTLKNFCFSLIYLWSGHCS